ncbi:Alpha/Beta hydrolase protein [Pisolithus microcarpus]|nr:Alpha/Beta hydrolase protein [Pisolithus microcarpus]
MSSLRWRPTWIWACFHVLKLATFLRAAPTEIPSAASFYVPQLPGLQQDPEHPLHIYAGHILSDPNVATANPNDVLAHLFFVMVKARRSADKERLMFWFNGGPGCSSFDGLMMEIGPWRMDDQGLPKRVDGGWEEYMTIVYVDQPAGTGLSYTSTDHYVHTLEEATDQLIQFLRTFYQVFPEYRTTDTFLGGESFAGQYIPYFAKGILDSDLNLPLRGAAIGNGWIDARNQYPAYIEYAVARGLVDLSSEHYKNCKKRTDECMVELNRITNLEPINVDQCEGLLSYVLQPGRHTVDGVAKCTNVYDVRLEDDEPYCGMQWPPEIANVTTYLDRTDVVRAFHAASKPESWVECGSQAGRQFDAKLSTSSITLLPDLLERIPVLLFAGDQDFICNYMGIESMIKSMTWNGEKGLGKVRTELWSVDGRPAGTWVSSRNLTYAKIFDASHMAPYDVPEVAHDMILRFVDMNFSAIVDGSARIPSSVGDDSKPLFFEDTFPSEIPAKSPEEVKAQWEAYYNAGFAVLILLLIAIAIGVCIWCRLRRRPFQLLRPTSNTVSEENIPLNSTPDSDDVLHRKFKGKERATEDEEVGTTIFDVGDDGDYHSDNSHHH